LESGCQGLAYNGGLFTQCPKSCMTDVRYCKGCQSEMDKNGYLTNGTVEQRLACPLMEFKDKKGRKPVGYRKIMEKLNITQETVEAEAGKQNIVIDEIHFVAGEKKEKKKKAEAISVAKEDDLLAQLLDDLVEDEEENEPMNLEAEVAEEKALKQDEEKALKALKQDEEKALKKQQQDEEKALKAQKKQQQDEEKAAKEAEKAAKAQQIADEKAAKAQQQADEKAAKDAEKAAKAQQIADEKAAKEAEKAAKAQQIADEKALVKQQKAQQIADEKALKEKKIADEKALKAQQIADEKALKKQQQEAEKAPKKDSKEKKQKEVTRTIVATKANFKVGDKVKHNELGVETIAIVTEVKMGKSFVEYNLRVVDDEREFVAPEGNIMTFKEPEAVAAAPKKVTVKRIVIEGKQYLKTADNLLYDPETKEEMGIYDPVQNTIKQLPDDDEDELSEDGMSDDE